jgi:hypothetical protein
MPLTLDHQAAEYRDAAHYWQKRCAAAEAREAELLAMLKSRNVLSENLVASKVTTPAINRKAIDLLYIYTGQTFQIGKLYGDGMKEQRRQIMSALHGRRMPISKSGVEAIRRNFYLMAGSALHGWTCEADREKKFATWAKTVTTP